MTSFIKSAKHVHDIDSDLSYVEIIYDRYRVNKGYETYTDYINTEPLANWTLLESAKHSISYEKFLDVMLKKTIEVRQRMAELIIDNLMSYEQPKRVYVRLVHAIKIIDPTFQPPRINIESAWQMELMKKISKRFIPYAIQECVDESRLEYFFNVVKTIDREQ
jgi:hypothetical protein